MQVERIQVTPNICDLTSELKLTIHYELSTAYKLRWTVEFIVDCAYSNIVFPLLQTTLQDTVEAGKHTQVLHMDQLNFGDIPEHVLMNAGMIVIRAETCADADWTEPQVVTELKCMTQVSKALTGGPLIRTMFNPLAKSE